MVNANSNKYMLVVLIYWDFYVLNKFNFYQVFLTIKFSFFWYAFLFSIFPSLCTVTKGQTTVCDRPCEHVLGGIPLSWREVAGVLIVCVCVCVKKVWVGTLKEASTQTFLILLWIEVFGVGGGITGFFFLLPCRTESLTSPVFPLYIYKQNKSISVFYSEGNKISLFCSWNFLLLAEVESAEPSEAYP